MSINFNLSLTSQKVWVNYRCEFTLVGKNTLNWFENLGLEIGYIGFVEFWSYCSLMAGTKKSWVRFQCGWFPLNMDYLSTFNIKHAECVSNRRDPYRGAQRGMCKLQESLGMWGFVQPCLPWYETHKIPRVSTPHVSLVLLMLAL